jgi:predicted alpha/beta-hydrolase family hydrolase
MLLADDPALAAALLLQSYPLHPPGRPASLRTEHLPRLRVPTLFVHGARDVFGTPAELERACGLIPATTRVLTVAGGHDLGWGARRRDITLPDRIAAAFLDLHPEARA